MGAAPGIKPRVNCLGEIGASRIHCAALQFLQQAGETGKGYPLEDFENANSNPGGCASKYDSYRLDVVVEVCVPRTKEVLSNSIQELLRGRSDPLFESRERARKLSHPASSFPDLLREPGIVSRESG